MKTIEQAATEYADKDRVTRSEHSAFVDGVMFAQRWISVEDDSPGKEDYENCLWKDKTGHIWFGRANQSQKPTHWRSIDLK